MKAIEVYKGSDGEVTKRYYSALCKCGVVGAIAMNLFRAQKCSERAKRYRGGIRGQGSYRDMAYERKQWSMGLLCDALVTWSDQLQITWGWKQDPAQDFNPWVLYVDLPCGQVSFHSPVRGKGPDYSGDWDRQHASVERIIEFCDEVFKYHQSKGEKHDNTTDPVDLRNTEVGAAMISHNEGEE
jgi:hypothetical protein